MNNKPIKISVLGASSGVGTTNIVNILGGGTFNENSPSSLTSSFLIKEVIIGEKKYELNIWDCGGGQEKYRSLRKFFIKDSDILILIHDITYQYSLDGIYYWYDIIKETLSNDALICIFANKIDLIEDIIYKEELCNYAESKRIKLKYVSAKENSKLIPYYVKELILDYLKNSLSQKIYDNELTKLKQSIKKLLPNYIALLNKYYNY